MTEPPAGAASAVPRRSSLRGRLSSLPVTVLVALALFGSVLAFWTILTPAYRSPDEPQHVSSVLRIAEGRGWPAAGTATMDPGVLRSQSLIGFTVFDGQRGNWGGGNLLPGVREETPAADLRFFALYSSQVPTAVDARAPYDELTPTNLDGRGYLDQMTQHPPLYYAVQAGALQLADAQDWRFDRQLALMRLVSASMVVWLPLLCFLTVRRLTGSVPLGCAAAVLPLAIPQLAHVGSSVNNDALVILIGGLLSTLLAYVVTGSRSRLLLAAVAVLLGLGLLTKGTMLAAVPVVALAVGVGLRRGSPGTAAARTGWWVSVGGSVAVLAGAFVVGGWWWLVNLLRYGTLQPSGLGEPSRSAPAVSLWEFTQAFVAKLSASSWGYFGWLELRLPSGVTTPLSVLVVVLVVTALAHSAVRVPLLTLLTLPALTLAAMFVTVYQAHVATGTFPGIQGRYLFGSLVVVIAAAAVAAGALSRRTGLPERWVPPIAAVLALALAGFGAIAAFDGFYVDAGSTPRQAWAFMSAWSPWPGPLVDLTALFPAGLGVALLVGTLCAALRPSQPEQSVVSQ